jgi:RNA polymerase sigma factor (sigma-70 family)
MPTNQPTEVIHHLHRAASLHEGAGLTDKQLLECFRTRRDEAAFAALVWRHGPMVMGVCRRVLHNPQDAEDAFQATFLVLVRKASSIAAPELLANWLYGVAHNAALKVRTAAGKQRTREKQVTDMPEPEAPVHERWEDLSALLDQELSRLPDKYRVPVVLCDLEGKTRKEAAEHLRCPEGTVAGRLARARTMLAKRLTRRGVTLSGGVLALVLSQNTLSAAVPTSLAFSTVKAASLIAAGEAVTTAVISARVAAVTEGVIRAMLIAKLRTTAIVLGLVAFAGLGVSALTHHALADGRESREPAPNADGRRADGGTSVISAKVVAVGKDGKSITLEMPPQTRGEEPPKLEIKLTDKTAITYSGVTTGGATLTEGYQAQVLLAEGSKDVAARVSLSGKETTRKSADFLGKIISISKDGMLTFEEQRGRRREDEARTLEVRLTNKTIQTFSFINKGGAKPTEGYLAEVWLERGSKDLAAQVNFIGEAPQPARGVVDKAPDTTGKIVGVAKDGKTFSVGVPSRGRGEEVDKREFKIDDKTDFSYRTVGPDGDKPTEGDVVQVWLMDGSKDTAAKVVLIGTPKEREVVVSGKVVGIAKDGKGMTLETRPAGRGEAGSTVEIKFTDKTSVVYQGVGPDGAKLTDGYYAQVWLEEGSKDTAYQALLSPSGGRR